MKRMDTSNSSFNANGLEDSKDRWKDWLAEKMLYGNSYQIKGKISEIDWPDLSLSVYEHIEDLEDRDWKPLTAKKKRKLS